MAKVLIADDDELMTEVLEAFLTDCGHEVQCAITGSDALDLGEKDRPDVLICDFSLPELDGPEVARRLQTQTPDLRVFVASGHSDRLVRAQSDGVNHLQVLTKPVDLGALEDSLRAALN